MVQAKKMLLVDIESCVGCHACEIACRQEHDLNAESGSSWCRVVKVGPRRIEGKLHMDFVPVLCLHCKDPLCSAVCPNNAICRTDDGLVVIDEAACNGCKLCIYGCPYGCIFFNEVKRTVGHCDLCKERTEAGLDPACVQHCIGGALQFILPEELEERTQGQHRIRAGRICYVSTRWRLHGPV